MEVLTLYNDYSYLHTENSGLKYKLWQAMRHRTKDYFMNARYRQKLWDGYIDFFDKRNGRFLTGLLTEVTTGLDYLKLPYKTIDHREPLKLIYDQVDEHFLNQFLPESGLWEDGDPADEITLEDYQVDFINLAIKHHRGTIKAPTASGKTFIMIGIMKALPPNTPILVLSNRKGVQYQNYKEIIKWGFQNVGLVDGDNFEPNLITCALIQSIKHIEKLLPKLKVIIVDEVHTMMSKMPIRCYKKLVKASFRIGLSATPFKHGNPDDDKDKEVDKVHKYNVKGYFGPVFKTSATESGKLTTSFLQERGRLSKSRCIIYPVDEPHIPYAIYRDAVTQGIAQSWHFHQLVTRLVSTLQGRTLILVERLAHGDTLQKLIPGALWIQGKDDNESRDYVIKRLQKDKGNVVAIATQGIFTVAINVFIHNLINAAGGKSWHDIVQRMGRGLRPANDKDILNYYDWLFRINPYLEKHSQKRIKILTKEKHEVIVKEAIDF